MHFAKLQACSNDYIFIDTFTQTITDAPALARRLTDYKKGVGGDGMILLCPSDNADYKMRVFNPDGSEAEMCGNALRCSAKYFYDLHLTRSNRFCVETLGGIKHITLVVSDGKVTDVYADIGRPVLDMNLIPCSLSSNLAQIKVLDKEFTVFAVGFGNPHCAVMCAEPEEIDLPLYGSALECCEYFPHKANVEFYKIIDKNNIYIRTWERNCGETLGCATGSCACVVAGRSHNLLSDIITVHQRGGRIYVNITSDGDIIINGSPTTVFTGELKL